MPSTLLDGNLFNKYIAVATASPQKKPGRLFAFIMQRAVTTTI
jgi:hypothetical protein